MTPWSMSMAVLAWSLAGPGHLVSGDMIFANDVEHYDQLVVAHHHRPRQTFRSSDILGPVFNIATWDRSLTDNSSHIFIGTRYGEYEDLLGGPMILDASDLSLVYAGQQYRGGFAAEPQFINGSRYIVFWDGLPGAGYALGDVLILDEQYHLRYNVTSVGASGADMHEAALTEGGTVIFTVYQEKSWDTTSLGGNEHGSIMDSGFQEVDLETNELIFEWYASDHFDITDSYREFYGKSFDFAHINSVEKTSAGNYLVSSRHMSSIILVDGNDGSPLWVMGGPRNEFEDLSNGTALNFAWQHQVRFHSDNQHLTMFDNHDRLTGPCDTECVTRGLDLEIDTRAKTARVTHEFYHPRNVNTAAQGGMQMLPNGNALLGFGYIPGYVEFTPDGAVALDFQRSRIDLDKSHNNGMNAYRIAKGTWVGRPTWPPSVAADAPHGTVERATLYLSWNGATDIAYWAIYSSDEPSDFHRPQDPIGYFDRSGFETTAFLGVAHQTRYVAAVAIDKAGEALGATHILDMQTSQPAGVLDISNFEFKILEDEVSGGSEDQDPAKNSQQGPPTEDQSGTDGHDSPESNHLVFGGGVVVLASAVSAFVYWRRRRGHLLSQGKSPYKALDTEGRV